VIVLDASALVELLLGTADGEAVASRIADPGLSLHVPHLVDLEIVQALRRYVREREIDGSDAKLMLQELRALDLQRHAHEPLLDRVWALRSNLTAYDAVYVALAEALDAVLVTCDRRLAQAPAVSRRVEHVRAERSRT
jgi:predicted nucleic acid-binding protein